MGALTIDASVAVRVALDHTAHASIIDRLLVAEAIYAPTIFVVETANAFCKYVKGNHVSEADALAIHRSAMELIDHSIDSAELFPEAFVLASRWHHPVYDALYLVTARRTSSTLLTLDTALAELARKLDIAVAVT
jgi:predicted nucleic acid-binding protein